MPMFAVQKIIDRVVAKQHAVEVENIDLVGIGRPDLAGTWTRRLGRSGSNPLIDRNAERFRRCGNSIKNLTQGTAAAVFDHGGRPQHAAPGWGELLEFLARDVNQQW